MDAAKWPQISPENIGSVKPMEEIVSNTCTKPMLERKARPQEQLNCPRCNSTNTKFCYYNNYSLTQPRYFCKTCRRYWTEGGSLRNVPVGGGSRKNKRSITSASSSSTTSKLPDLNPPSLSQFSSQNSKTTHKGQDLNLAFQVMHETTHHDHMSPYVEVPKTESNSNNNNNNNNQNSSLSSAYNSSSLSALDLLRTGITSRGLDSFMPTPMPDSNTLFSSGFPLQDIKPTLSFSIDGLGNRFGNVHGVQENGGRLFFPFGDLKQLSSTTEVDQNKGQGSSSGYWNGMFGGGSW